jgi:hypothetical protein
MVQTTLTRDGGTRILSKFHCLSLAPCLLLPASRSLSAHLYVSVMLELV